MKIVLLAVRSADVACMGRAEFNDGKIAFLLQMRSTAVDEAPVPVMSVEVALSENWPGAGIGAQGHGDLTLAAQRLVSAVESKLWQPSEDPSVKRGRLLKQLLLAVENASDDELESTIASVSKQQA